MVKQEDKKLKKKDKKHKKHKKKDCDHDLPKMTKKKGTIPVMDTQLDLDTSDSEVNEAIKRYK